jgi:peptide-methionine (S)-S-oxide reductase
MPAVNPSSSSPTAATTTSGTSNAATERAIFAAGCFWGVEHAYKKNFPGLLNTRVGYAASSVQDTTTPTYDSVCTGHTPYAEALLVTFDPSKTSYRDLVEFFFRMHDPTTRNSQGLDRGSQYRSAVFWESEAQKKVVADVVARVGREWWTGKEVVTEVAREFPFSISS